MKLSELKQILLEVSELNFELPTGELVPRHFHITEVGQVYKNYIDCGGMVRQEKNVSLQLWEAGDHDHKLAPAKLKSILTLSEKVLKIEDGVIEIEYQRETIGKYGLDFNGKNFLLTKKFTDCLAKDKCGEQSGVQCCADGCS